MNRVLYICLILTAFSCSNELEKLTPPAERSAAAVADLQDELTSAANGWVLNYQPTGESGIFYMLLDFKENGTVDIQSDVPGDDNTFYDQTVSYRIDSRLGLELIFETYGVFHFLFEQNASSFGAEFEFIFEEKSNSILKFSSKTDNASDQTIISLEPAGVNAENAFSRELAENLLAYDTIKSGFIGVTQQLAIASEDISVFWSVNLDQRNLNARGVAQGLTNAEIVANDKTKVLDHSTGYGFFNGKLVLTDPLEFSFQGNNYTIEEISLNNFTQNGEVICPGGTINSPVYTGSVKGLGSATLYKTLFDVKGLDFDPQSDSPYSINVFFVVDANGFSMSTNGSINEFFPNATGFAFNYGFEDTDSVFYACAPSPADSLVQPANAVGLYYEDDQRNRKVALRKFDVVSASENKIEIQFTSSADPADDYFPCDITTEEMNNLESITDEIFGVGGGEVYAIYLPIDSQPDLTVFTLYNPCNNYEFLLVQ